MPKNRDSETVWEILTRKLAKIRAAPLDKGSPSWDDIAGETWKTIRQKARRRVTGYRTFKKLLTCGRFDKE